MKIFLVRHAESTANADPTVYNSVANHAVPLSPRGCEQAQEVGKFLLEEIPDPRNPRNHCELWSSTYLRAKQTAEYIQSAIGTSCIWESLFLCERSYGLFDGVSKEERGAVFPQEWGYYQKQKSLDGEFYARLPMGESFFDVAVRVSHLFRTLERIWEYSPEATVVIASHAHTIRAFTMMWCQKNPDWFMKEPDPPNASVRLIFGRKDMGYVLRV